MKKFLAAMFLLLVFTGCDVANDSGVPNQGIGPVASTEVPTVNLPIRLRQKNWEGKKLYRDSDGKLHGEGSCVHATMISLFRWQGRYWMADHWRKTYDSGETPDAIIGDPNCNLKDKLDREGVRYAYTTDGDVAFLEWACSTRRGCGVTVMGGRHMVALVHLDGERAGIMDPNNPKEIYYVPREQFIAEWQNSNGWAVTPVYTPAPPLP